MFANLSSIMHKLIILFVFMNFRPPPNFPKVILHEDLFLSIAHSVRHKINETFAIFRYVASGKDLKKFLMVKLQYLISFSCNLPLILSRENCCAGNHWLVGSFYNWQLVQFFDFVLHWSVPFHPSVFLFPYFVSCRIICFLQHIISVSS